MKTQLFKKTAMLALSMSLLISFAFGLNFAGSSLSSESADAKTVGAIFDIGDEVSDFNSENLTILYDRINRGSTTYKELSDSLGTENGKVLRTSAQMSALGMTSILLGGLKWNAVAASKDANGDVVLTLWLANSLASKSFAKCSSTSVGKYAANEYGTSFVRACIVGGDYAETAYATNTATQDETLKAFLNKYESFIITPSQIEYQGAERASVSWGESNDYINEAYNTISGSWSSATGQIQNCTGYGQWKDDKLWLPSRTETGYNTSNTGLWNLSSNVRADSCHTWVRTGTTGGSRGEQTYAVLLGSNGNSFYTDNVNSSGGRLGSGTTYVSYGVRPAFHLNLKSAANAAGQDTGEDEDETYPVAVPAFNPTTGFVLSADKMTATTTFSSEMRTISTTEINASITVTPTNNITINGDIITLPKNLAAGTYYLTMNLPESGYIWEDTENADERQLIIIINAEESNPDKDTDLMYVRCLG